jgi:hypothetical protein
MADMNQHFVVAERKAHHHGFAVALERPLMSLILSVHK